MVVTAASLVCMLGFAQVPPEAPAFDAAAFSEVKRDARNAQRQGDYDEAARLLESFASGAATKGDPRLKDEAERVAARYHAVATSFSRARTDPARCAPLFARVLLAGHRFVPLTSEDAERALVLLEGSRPGLAAVVERRLVTKNRAAATRTRHPEPQRARLLLEAALDELEQSRL